MLISDYLEEVGIENLASDPTTGLIVGRFYYNTATKQIRIYDGTVWQNYAGDAGSAVLTNKDIDGGTASNTSRITIPKGTFAAITALTRKAGTILYGTDTGLFYRDNGSGLLALAMGTIGQSQWDEALGSNGPQSLYSSTNWATTAPSTYHDVVILGNLTIDHDLEVTGNLYVTGSITNSNDAVLNVAGDTVCLGVSVSLTIDSDLFFKGNFTCPNLIGDVLMKPSSASVTQRTIRIGGTFSASNGSQLYRLSTASIGTPARSGFHVQVGGDLIGGVDTSSTTSGAGGPFPGGDLTVGGSVRCGSFGISTNGGFGGGDAGTVLVGGDLVLGGGSFSGDGRQNSSGGGAGGAGANVTINGSLIGSGNFNASGGTGSTGAGGAGGFLTVKGDISKDSTLIMGGGAGNGAFVGGLGGVLVVKGDVYVGSIIRLNGGTSGTTYTGAGAVSGKIDVRGSCRTDNDLDIKGGNNTLGNGGDLAASCLSVGGDLKVEAELSVFGGNGVAGGGGTGVFVSGKGDIDVTGTIYLPKYSTNHYLKGGNGTTGNGGDAPSVTCGKIICHSRLNIDGGNSTSAALGVPCNFVSVGGGIIQEVYANPGVTGTPNATVCGFGLSGTTNIGVWSVEKDDYTGFRFRTASQVLGIVDSNNESPGALLSVEALDGDAGVHTAALPTADNRLPAGGIGASALMLGRNTGGNTSWRFAQFLGGV